ncbi:hypothetical protein B6N60_03055 [Richelia sinica FACHB-800]|uniref:Uncharacterized protein n=1 Tax=Richelia sinica FACHB-800 TaxID=1357546 RepID=A0A975T9F0_9NOST|nr:hypothetical protein [Richelia sinica]MBD2665005.1 hypothetical protein [Richelia sinica FACHB-800]QXE24350.1 hypothetical protein B6N60_03055 [Richelia sinica FACHB-800]
MRDRSSTEKRNFSVFAAIKLVILTFFFGSLMFCGFSTGSLIISYLTSSFATVTPTFVPGIKDAERCDSPSRVWRDNQCWDYQPNAAF